MHNMDTRNKVSMHRERETDRQTDRQTERGGGWGGGGVELILYATNKVIT